MIFREFGYRTPMPGSWFWRENDSAGIGLWRVVSPKIGYKLDTVKVMEWIFIN